MIKKYTEKTKDTRDEEVSLLANAINCPIDDARNALQKSNGDFGVAMYLVRQEFNGLSCEEKNRRRK